MECSYPPFGIPSEILISESIKQIEQPPTTPTKKLVTVDLHKYPYSRISLNVDENYGYVILRRELLKRKKKDRDMVLYKFGKHVPSSNKHSLLIIYVDIKRFNVTEDHFHQFIIDHPEFFDYLYHNSSRSYFYGEEDEEDEEDEDVDNEQDEYRYRFNDYDSEDYKLWTLKIRS